MTIPFLDLVKKAKDKFQGKRQPAAFAPLPSVEDKPEADKLAKRVMPYAVRTLAPEPSAPARVDRTCRACFRKNAMEFHVWHLDRVRPRIAGW